MLHLVATIASLVAAMCNLALVILLYHWYGSNGGKR